MTKGQILGWCETAKKFHCDECAGFTGGEYVAGTINSLIDLVGGGLGNTFGLGSAAGTFSQDPTLENAPGAFLDAVSIAGLAAAPMASGTTHTLTTEEGTVVRTGRTLFPALRELQHGYTYSDLDFNLDQTGMSYCEMRGREKVISDHYQPILDKINAISPTNPMRQTYLNAASRLGGVGQ